MPFFAGDRYQRGHGLGSILSGLFSRIIMPFLSANGRTIASKAIKTGLEVADDVAHGKSLKEFIPKGIKEATEKINWQTGSGTWKSKRRGVPRNRRRRHYNDIFA